METPISPANPLISWCTFLSVAVRELWTSRTPKEGGDADVHLLRGLAFFSLFGLWILEGPTFCICRSCWPQTLWISMESNHCELSIHDTPSSLCCMLGCGHSCTFGLVKWVCLVCLILCSKHRAKKKYSSELEEPEEGPLCSASWAFGSLCRVNWALWW